MIYRHNYFRKLITDRGFENKEVIEKLTQRYKIKKVILLTYYLKTNNMIERRYKSIIDTLLKMLDEGSENWVQNLPAVL